MILRKSRRKIIHTPLQIPAAPYWPDLRACRRETTIRAPELPMACPKATAPLNPHISFGKLWSRSKPTYPLTLIFSDGILRIFSAARTTTEKASLISKSEISLIVRFAASRALGRATVGAIGKSIGARPASAYAFLDVSHNFHSFSGLLINTYRLSLQGA